jgi:small nuclear ribonucleoprotein (snRNP)-like protein
VNSIESIFSSLLLIVPGFIAYSLLIYMLGFRVREFSVSLIWSAFFVAVEFSFLAMLKTLSFTDGLRNFFSVDVLSRIKLGSKGNIEIPGIGLPDIFYILMKLAFFGVIAAVLLSLVLKNRRIKYLTEKLSGHSLHMDVWNDYFIEIFSDQIIIVTKDDNEFYGTLVHASDNPTSKSLILSDVKYRDKSGDFKTFVNDSLSNLMYIQSDNIARIFQVKTV